MQSVWYRYFCDVELKRIIRQDVIRTSPDKQFFQLPQVQEIMVDVLFIYARENPDMCYRQVCGVECAQIGLDIGCEFGMGFCCRVCTK